MFWLKQDWFLGFLTECCPRPTPWVLREVMKAYCRDRPPHVMEVLKNWDCCSTVFVWKILRYPGFVACVGADVWREDAHAVNPKVSLLSPKPDDCIGQVLYCLGNAEISMQPPGVGFCVKSYRCGLRGGRGSKPQVMSGESRESCRVTSAGFLNKSRPRPMSLRSCRKDVWGMNSIFWRLGPGSWPKVDNVKD